MRLRTLGTLSLEPNEAPYTKPLLLLAYVSLEGPQRRGPLARLFWPGATHPRNRLSVTLTRLRKFAPAAVETPGREVRTSLRTDAGVVMDLLARGRAASAARLYRGGFLEGVHVTGLGEELGDWILHTRESLARSLQLACLQRAQALAGEERFAEACDSAATVLDVAGTELLEPDDLRLLHAVLLAGESPRAGLVRAEAEGLGLVATASRGVARAHLRRGGGAVPTNVHVRASASFVGREDERRVLAGMLASANRPLITLLGPGGIGKSQLAWHVAVDQLHRRTFPGGVHHVELEAVEGVSALPAAMADALEVAVPAGQTPLWAVTRAIGDQRMLIVLDNFEHLVAGAMTAAELLRSCENLRLLVTSREPLALRQEALFPVPGFAAPDGEGAREVRAWPALELFERRARRVEPHFRLTPGDVPHVASICRRTGGSPLALELAAGLMHVVPVATLAREIAGDPDVLDTPARDARDRHRSLRSVFEHSWALLSEEERTCVRRLSVFKGGFTRDAALEVTGTKLKPLASLLEKSLLTRDARERYQRHPLVHQYSEEKLAEDPRELARMRARHAAWMLALAEAALPHVNARDGGAWLARLEAEHANLREALAWADREGEAATLARLALASVDYWIRRGHLGDALHWFARVEARAGEVDDPALVAEVLVRHSYLCFVQRDYDTPRRLLEHSLAISRRLNDASGTARAMSHLGILAIHQGEFATARAHYARALELARAHGDTALVARLLNNIGDVLRYGGDPAAARPYYRESVALERRLGNHQMESNVLGSLGMVALAEGDLSGAKDSLRASLALVRTLGISISVPPALEQLAELASAERDVTRAARAWGAAEALRERLGSPLESFARPSYEEAVARARRGGDAGAFAAAWAEGRRSSEQEAIALALGEAAPASLPAGPNAGVHRRPRRDASASRSCSWRWRGPGEGGPGRE